MLVYRAPLDGPGPVLSVTVRPLRAPRPGPGAAEPSAPYALTLRYSTADGRVQTHRGRLVAAVAPGTPLMVAGWQATEGALLVSLRPAPPRRGTSRGGALSDRFRLPFQVSAWGVTAVSGAVLALSCVCRAVGTGSLLVRGTLRLTLHSPSASFDLRLPYCRVVAADVPADCRWSALVGVTGFHVRVAPGGQISGEAVLAVRCEGRPAPAPPGPRADLQAVRELTALPDAVVAEPATPGHAVVRGTVQLDLYYTDGTGASRWAGRRPTFSALVAVPGADPDDRLEAAAVVQRLTHRPADGLSVHLIVAVTVTALRRSTVTLEGLPCRIEQVIATGTVTVVLTETFWPPDPNVSLGRETRSARLPLAGPPTGWEEVAAVLSTPRAAAQPGHGQWQVKGSLGGTPLNESPYPAPLRAATGGTVALDPGHGLAVVPSLVSVDTSGLGLVTTLARGPVLPPLPLGEAEAVGEVGLRLPGAPRRILALAARGAALSALVGVEGVGLVVARAPLPPGTVPPDVAIVSLTAFPVQTNEEWRLHIHVALRRENG